MRVRGLGRRHYTLGVHPAWIAGAYLVYWRHWDRVVDAHATPAERAPLRGALLRLLLGDLMAQLEGYAAQVREADAERLTVVRVLLEVMAHPLPEGSPPMALMTRICESLVREVEPVVLGAFAVAAAQTQDAHAEVRPECAAGIALPELRLPVAVEAPAILAVDDAHAAHWTAPLRGRAREVAVFPFGHGGLRGTGVLASAEAGYFQRVGAAFFLGFSHLGSLVLRLREHALRDPLTGLPNRALFGDRLAHERVRSGRLDRLLAVGILDLDGFKEVNDRYGHGAGDELLIALGARLETLLRGGDTLARMGGDEFGLLLPELRDVAELDAVCLRLLKALRTPVPVGDGQWVSVSASLGVTIYPLDDAEAEGLLRHADEALYAAKHAGKNQYRLYSTEFDAAVQNHARMHDTLAGALAEGRLRLYYQPIVGPDGEVAAVEALLRLHTAEGALVGPEAFHAALDHPHLARPVGRFVLRAAAEQAAAWAAGGWGRPIHVNIAAAHLLDPEFLRDVDEAWPAAGAAHGAGPRPALVVEISESAPLSDLEHAAEVIHQLAARGIEVALDDLGTGHASLHYLQRLPAATLKIDRNFVRDITTDTKDLAIVAGVVVTAQILGLRVVAEGVETAAHAQLLARIGCRYLQGFWIARPMEGERFADWVRTFRMPAAAGPEPVMTGALPEPARGLVLEGHAGRVRRFIEALRRGERPPEDVVEPGAERRCLLGRWLETDGRERLHSACAPVRDAITILHERLHAHARAAMAAAAASAGPHAAGTSAVEEHLRALEADNRVLLGLLYAVLAEPDCASGTAFPDTPAEAAHERP